MSQGKLFVIYGANNLGKTTVATKIATEKDWVYLKYPIYDLVPTGPTINSIIRKGIHMEPLDLQRQYAQNKRDYQSTLLSILDSGKTVIAEDYTGTGIAWGMVEGIPSKILERINHDIKSPDKAVLLDGERFSLGRERDHRFEDGNWERAREVFRFLAERYGWEVVNANQTGEKVCQDILKIFLSS